MATRVQDCGLIQEALFVISEYLISQGAEGEASGYTAKFMKVEKLNEIACRRLRTISGIEAILRLCHDVQTTLNLLLCGI